MLSRVSEVARSWVWSIRGIDSSRQRSGTAQALCHRPDLLIVEEDIHLLDAVGQSAVVQAGDLPA
jgi:ABC-type taurine transport system ATPase subunit